jgi:hypothetical protein
MITIQHIINQQDPAATASYIPLNHQKHISYHISKWGEDQLKAQRESKFADNILLIDTKRYN